MQPRPLSHTCLNTSKFAAVFVDDVSDSPTIACPGFNDDFIHFEVGALGTDEPVPLANSTRVDTEEIDPPADTLMDRCDAPCGPPRVTPGPFAPGHADAPPNTVTLDDLLPNLDRAPRGLRVGPREYAYVIEELWPFTIPTLAGTDYHLDIYDLVRATGVPNYMGARIRIPSQINWDAWDALLYGYHDAEVADFLRFGWPGGYTAPTPPTPSDRNHPSAVMFPDQVQKFLDKEVDMGAMLGPFPSPPFYPWSQVSPLMSVEKKDTTSRRIIIDLSFPIGEGVNSGVPKNYFQGSHKHYSLPTVTDLANLVISAGPGSYLWKADLERAYCQLRCDPLDYPLMGITHAGAFFTDICPSFGCRGSSMSQQRVSDAVCYLMSTENFKTLAYVDDFCGIQQTLPAAEEAYAAFVSLTDTLGLKLAPDKCFSPSTKMEWLGFLFDTEAMSITLPSDKLRDIITMASAWKTKQRATRRDLQQLAGKLNHISQCVVPARKFMCRILAALRAAPQCGTIKVSEPLRHDVAWFAEYAATCNGRLLMEDPLPTFGIQCDACLEGGGGFSDTHFYSTQFTDPIFSDMHISQIEAFNILLAIKTLLPQNARSLCVVITTDNSAAMHTLNTGKTRDPILAACSRELWLFAAVRELKVVVNHAPGASLVLADALSRRHMSQFHDDVATQMVRHLGLSQLPPYAIDSILTPNL